jgi:hypothetical protein
MLKIWYTELERRNLLLAKSGAFCFLLGVFVLFLPWVDPRVLLGQFVWIKPAKFFFSVGIYFWTLGWLLDHIQDPDWVKKISWTAWSMMCIELIIITYQASLAKMSHFNNQTLLDGVLFGIMGLAITINSLLVIWILIRFFRIQNLPKGYLWAIRLGILIFLIAGYQGFLMVSLRQHTVGAPDGQDGLLFLGWAKSFGDLRVFHFLGIHALQLLPLLGWYLWRDRPVPVILTGVIYFLLCTLSLWLALLQKGMFSWMD